MSQMRIGVHNTIKTVRVLMPRLFSAMPDAPSLPRRSSPTSSTGRIRGRPRLIGDELDAELVEHLLDLRKEQGRSRWSANTVLK